MRTEQACRLTWSLPAVFAALPPTPIEEEEPLALGINLCVASGFNRAVLISSIKNRILADFQLGAIYIEREDTWVYMQLLLRLDRPRSDGLVASEPQ